MTSRSTNSAAGNESEYNDHIEMESRHENEADNRSTVGSINDGHGGHQDGEKCSEETGTNGEEKEETGMEDDSDDDFPSEFGEGVPLVDDGVFEAEEDMYADSKEWEWYASGPEYEYEDSSGGSVSGSESDG
ncbi:hypothetical protein MMC34_003744 [Xylographa carneopallida]|nr:hypothetical protein [Xylographa carneopallida]